MFDGQLDRVYRALSSTYRRWMIEIIAGGPVSVLELAESFPMSFSAVVQHLKVLEQCGLVQTQKVGRIRTCRLNPDTLGAAKRWLGRTQWEYYTFRDYRLRPHGFTPRDLRLLGALERPEGE